MYYIVYVMEAAGIGNPLLQASIQYILNVALTLPAILYVDKWGRRPSFLYGSLLMMVLMFVVGTLEAIYGEPFHTDTGPLAAISWIVQNNDAVSRGVVACSYLFVCTFAVTWVCLSPSQHLPPPPSCLPLTPFQGPASWTYPSEIFPSQIRAKGVSLATASNWSWNTAIAFATPPLFWTMTWKVFMLFGAFNGAAFVHMFLTAPETKGKTLEEMDEVFDRGRPAWVPVQKGSRLDVLQKEIEEGKVKVAVAFGKDEGRRGEV